MRRCRRRWTRKDRNDRHQEMTKSGEDKEAHEESKWAVAAAEDKAYYQLYEELKGKDKTEQKGYTGWLTPGRGDQRT